jgi:hypothetical protein
MTQPIEYGVDDYQIQTLFSSLSGLTALKAVSYTADDETLKNYGLDTPKYTFEIDFPDKNYKLYVGNKNTDGNYYIMTPTKNAVYEIAASNIEFILLNEYDLAKRTDIIPNIDDVSAITIGTTDKTYSFTLNGTGDNLTVYYKGNAIDTENFRNFYINNIRINFSPCTQCCRWS